NPQGKLSANDFIFPYANNSFDLVILTSVFTHMLGTPMENYLMQISRVLEAGGRSFITYYLRTPLSAQGIFSGKSTFNFNCRRDGCWIQGEGTPEAAVCYDLTDLEALYAEAGLSIEKVVTTKWWDGSEPTGQDFIVARKAGHG
ncbi:MAG: class I SAM-dependent methyltransferase, partial [Xanthobacteraceae bacterium]|nr:class I SAM-dependent methyltransferase [Xanthobacteraceae bacterium]